MKTNEVMCDAAYGAVDAAVDRTVYVAGHMFWAVDRALTRAVYRAVDRARHWIVERGVSHAPAHPAFADFLSTTDLGAP